MGKEMEMGRNWEEYREGIHNQDILWGDAIFNKKGKERLSLTRLTLACQTNSLQGLPIEDQPH